MKTIRLFLLLVLLQTNFFLSAKDGIKATRADYAVSQSTHQDNSETKDSIIPRNWRKIITDSLEGPETTKIYLHIDRNEYLTGDTIWFKALALAWLS